MDSLDSQKERVDFAEPDPHLEEPPYIAEFADSNFDHFEMENGGQNTVSRPPAAPRVPDSFDPPAIRLPRLSSEELEHHDDSRLDDAFEERLLLTGDDLLPIRSVDTLVKMLFGEQEAPISARPAASPGERSAAAAKPAFDVAQLRTELAQNELDVPLPELGTDPTAVELEQYAKAHPTVRSIIRVFRAKVIDVSVE